LSVQCREIGKPVTLQVQGRSSWPSIKVNYRSHTVALLVRFPRATQRELNALCDELAQEIGVVEVILIGKLVKVQSEICSSGEPKGRNQRITDLRDRVSRTMHQVEDRYVKSPVTTPRLSSLAPNPTALPA